MPLDRNILPRLGEPATVAARLPKFFRCDGGEPVARSVHTELYSPENLPVAHEVGGLLTLEEEYQAQVRFTPDAAGPYHLVARFEPSLGTAQLGIFPIIDRSNRPADPALTLPSTVAGGCYLFWLTSRGGVLCSAHDGVIVLFRGAQTTQTFNADRVAVAGDVVWLSLGSTVARYVDTGSGRFEGPLEAQSPAPVMTLAAGQTDVIAVGQSSAHRLEVGADGGLEASTSWTYDAGFGLVLGTRVGDGLVIGSQDGAVCRGGLAGGALSCMRVNHALVTASDQGLWTAPSASELHRWSPTGHVVVSSPFLVFPAQRLFDRRPVYVLPNVELFSFTADEVPLLVDLSRDGGWSPVALHESWTAWRSRTTGDVEFVRY